MFILDNPKSQEPTFIFVKRKLSDGTFKKTTGLKLQPAYWNSTTERAETENLDSKTTAKNKSINAFLSRIETYIEQRERDACYGAQHLKCAELDEKILDMRGKKARADKFFPSCRNILERMKTGEILNKKGKKYSEGTARAYNKVIKMLEEFNPQLGFNDIGITFYNSFQVWCNGKEYSLNYFGHLIKIVKGLMEISYNQGLHKNKEYERKEFKILEEETQDIAPSREEFDAIYQVSLDKEHLQIARDWFIINCCTGLRIIDLKTLNEKNLTGNFLQISNEKTDAKVVIPIHEYVKEILKRYGGFPPKMADQKINEYIKIVAKQAGITHTFLYIVTKGGVRQDQYMPAYEMYSNHTARRFLITYLLDCGVADNKVMQLVGIKKHATLLKYKKTTPEKNAETMSNHEFYQ